MAAGSRSGESSHWRSSRPPIGVTVASIVSSSVHPRAPARSGSTSSRLRRVISSSQRKRVGAADDGPSEMGKAGRLQLAEVAEQGTGSAERGRIVGSETETVERGEGEAAASSSRARSASNSHASRSTVSMAWTIRGA